MGFKTAAIIDYNMNLDHDNIAKNHGTPKVGLLVNSDREVETKEFHANNYHKALEYAKEQFFNDFSTEVRKIISGGQTGADILGLQVAQALGLETGGYAPQGYTRESEDDGITSDDLKSFGLTETTPQEDEDYINGLKEKGDYHENWNYKFHVRTKKNVMESDGTILFSPKSNSGGTRLTVRFAKENGKPYLVNPKSSVEIYDWLIKNNIKTLNVAGNRLSIMKKSDPKAYGRFKRMLTEALTRGRVLKDASKRQSKKIKEVDVHSQEYLDKVKDLEKKAKEYNMVIGMGPAGFFWGNYAHKYMLRKTDDPKSKGGFYHRIKSEQWFDLPYNEKVEAANAYAEASKILGKDLDPELVDDLKKAMKINITPFSQKDRDLKKALLYNRVKSSDGVFIIDRILEPGDSYTREVGDPVTYTNRSDRPMVADTQSALTLLYAEQLGKPIHVFDDTHGEGNWYILKDGKFEMENMPVLTKSPVLTGAQGYKGSLYEMLGPINYNAIRDLFLNTFEFDPLRNFNAYNDRIDPSDLNDIRRLAFEATDNYTFPEVPMPAETPQSKLNREIPPKYRKARVKMIAHDIPMFLDDLVERLMKEIDGDVAKQREVVLSLGMKRNELSEKKEWTEDMERELREQNRNYKRLIRYQGIANSHTREEFYRLPIEEQGSFYKTALDRYGFGAFYERARAFYQMDLEGREKKKGPDSWDVVEMKKLLDPSNFKLLMMEALDDSLLAERIGMSIIPTNMDIDSFTEPAAIVGKNADTLQNEEKEFSDDESGERMAGNDGWTFKVRMIDPATSMSAATKNLFVGGPLGGIPVVDPKNGKFMNDDIGCIVYHDPNTLRAQLIDACSDMMSADDFSTPIEWDENGRPVKWRVDGLERLKDRYPWVKWLFIFGHIDTNPQAISALYHDIHLTYIQYVGITRDGVPVNINVNTPEDAALDAMVANIENSINLSEDSLYQDGESAPARAKKLNNQLTGIMKHMQEDVPARLLGTKVTLLDEAVVKDPKAWASASYEWFSREVNNTDKIRPLTRKKFVREIKREEIVPVNVLTNMLRAFGMDVNEKYVLDNISYLLQSKDGTNAVESTKFYKLYTAMRNALEMIQADAKREKRKTMLYGYETDAGKNKKNVSFLERYKGPLKEIAKIAGDLEQVPKIQGFLGPDNKMRYSYSAPNFMDTLNKAVHLGEKGRKWLMEQYGQDPWFRDPNTGEWHNEWLKTWMGTAYSKTGGVKNLEEDDNNFFTEEFNVKNILGIGAGNDAVEYARWNEKDTYKAMIALYYSNSKIQVASYICPPFADAPACVAVTMRRYGDTTTFPDNWFYDHKKSLEDHILPLLANVVMQEFGRMNLIEARKRSDAGQIQSFDKNGSKLLFFPVLENYELGNGNSFKEEVYRLLDNDAPDAAHELAQKVLKDVMDQAYEEFRDRLRANFTDRELLDQLIALKVLPKEYDKDNFAKIEPHMKALFWNDTFAQTQIIQLTNTDIAYSKNPVDFYKRFKQFYASGKRMNTNSKYGRKYEHTVYIKDYMQTSASYSGLKKSMQGFVDEKKLSSATMNWILEGAKNINLADAQAFRNPYALRAVMDMMGEWSPEMDESFNRMISGQWDEKDLIIMYKVVKPFLVSADIESNGVTDKKSPWYGKKMRVVHQNKNSEFVPLAFYQMLAYSLRDSEFMRGLNLFFNDHPEVDVIQFESAVKNGGSGAINLNYNEDKVTDILDELGLEYDENNAYQRFKDYYDEALDKGEITQEEYNKTMDKASFTAEELADELDYWISPVDDSETDFAKDNYDHNVVHKHSYENYMVAQPTPNHAKDITEGTAGSQFRNLITANLPEDFSIEIKGKILNKEQILTLYDSATVDNLLDSFEEVQEAFGNDIHALQRILLGAMRDNPKYGRDIKKALDIIKVPDPDNPGQTKEIFNLPPDLPTVANQIQDLITSISRKKVHKQTINGGAAYQVAAVGLNRHLQIVRREDGSIKEVQCLLPAWSQEFFERFKVKKPNPYNPGESYEEIDIKKIEKECPDLLRMVGYRIPTENKYSMLPLRVVGFMPQTSGATIMLPADITLIAGSDFDIDKMFLRIPMIDKQWYKKTGKVRKLEYSLDGMEDLDNEYDVTNPEHMTKRQRDNFMIDMEYAILTSKVGSQQLYSPGNFEGLKREAAIAQIEEDKKLLDKFMEKYTGSMENYTARRVLDVLYAKDKDGQFIISTGELNGFLSKYKTPLNLLYPQSYVWARNTIMQGAGFVGVCANASSAHTKAQRSLLHIKDGLYPLFDGIPVKDLNLITVKDNTGYERYVQEVLAEFQGASVDNAKEQVMPYLNITPLNIGNALLLSRLGLSDIAVSNIMTMSKLADIDPRALIKRLSSIGLDVVITPNKAKHPSLTMENLMQLRIYFHRYPKVMDLLINGVKVVIGSKELVAGYKPPTLADKIEEASYEEDLDRETLESIADLLSDFSFFWFRINQVRRDLKPVNDIMKHDSPNNAMATNFSGAILQKRGVTVARARLRRKESTIAGGPGDVVREVIGNKIVTLDMSREEKKKAIMSARNPTVQGFYSLGIELPLEGMQKYFVQGDAQLYSVAANIMNSIDTGMMGESDIRTLYRDFIQFVLSGTKMFGTDENLTFTAKRDYYLYKFPDKFMILKRKYKELMENPTISRMILKGSIYPAIILPKSYRNTQQAKEDIKNDFASLLYSENPEIRRLGWDLFMYSYYHDGFNFSGSSFGIYFDENYWNNCQEVIDTLRNLRGSAENNTALYERFMGQWIANHARNRIIKFLRVGNTEKYTDAGSLWVDEKEAKVTFSGEYAPFLTYYKKDSQHELQVYRLNQKKGDKLLYVPMPIFDDPDSVYDFNRTAEDMAKEYYNGRYTLLEAKRKLKKQQDEEINNREYAIMSGRVTTLGKYDWSTDNNKNSQSPTATEDPTANIPDPENMADKDLETVGKLSSEIDNPEDKWQSLVEDRDKVTGEDSTSEFYSQAADWLLEHGYRDDADFLPNPEGIDKKLQDQIEKEGQDAENKSNLC